MNWLKALFSAVGQILRYFSDKQLLDAGKAEQVVENIKEVERRVEQADQAVRVDDPTRTKRLRKRFDRGSQ